MATKVIKAKFSDSRDAFLVSYCNQKSVLHIGAADYPYMEHKFNEGRLLHTKLKCSKLVAVDTSPEGCGFLEQKDFECHLAFDSLNSDAFDIVLVPEVVEHLTNYSELLQSLAEKFPKSEMVITTPNPFSIKRTLEAYLGYERYHPDHLSYISYTNLSTALDRMGFEIKDVIGTFLPRVKITKKIRFSKWIARYKPLLSDNLIYICGEKKYEDNSY